MRTFPGTTALIVSVVFSCAAGNAQLLRQGAQFSSTGVAPLAATAPTAVPALVPYSGTAFDAGGKSLTGERHLTFLIFKDEQGGEPLWVESQMVAVDAAGHYAAQLGAANPNGLPSDLFATGEARWLEVEIAGGPAQPRVLLASVPYALKAGDSATLGGLPASAFALAGSKGALFGAAAAPAVITPDAGTNVTTTGGTSGFLPAFTGAFTVGNSILYSTSTGLGVGDVPNASAVFDVNGKSIWRGTMNLSRTGNATTSAGTNSFPFSFTADAYNSSSKGYVSPVFYWQAEATGNNTTAPGATMNLLYNKNSGTGAETGLYFNPTGTIHFASGQTFPGTGSGDGTITAVTAGTGLTGGGTSGKVTLNLNTATVPTLAGNNSFTGSNTFVPSMYENLDINIDNNNTNSGGISPGLRFGNGSGEGMSSQRTSGANQYGLDLYTGYSRRLSILASGAVGIGTTLPGAQLEVNGNLKITSGSGGGFIFADGTSQSTAFIPANCGADYAESVGVTGDRTDYKPGDILVIDPSAPGKFLKSNQPYSTMVAGIYSTQPGFVGRFHPADAVSDATEVPMAMVGRVPTKVSAENGPVRVGDLLVSSSRLGYAMKGTDRSQMLGAVVGKALGSLDSGIGVIEVLVTLQ